MECKNNRVNYKDIIGSFLPLIAAVLIQYLVNIADIIILFARNMRSDTKSNNAHTIESIMQQDYNQPVNQAYLTLAQYIAYILCFGIWYYKAIYKPKKSAGDTPKRTFLSVRWLFLIPAGFACQIMVDGIMALVRPLFTEVFAQYDQMVSKVVGVHAAPAMLVAAILFAPIGEELLFRGVIQGYAKRYMPIPWAIAFQGLLFGLYHGNIIQGIYATVLGCVLGFVAWKAGSILPSMLLHLCINASVLIVPAVWFEERARCIILTIISTLLFCSMVFLVTNQTRFRKNGKTE